MTESVPVDPDAPVVEEFVLGRDLDASTRERPASFREVFTYEDEHAYRFERSQGRTCFCACIEPGIQPVTSGLGTDG